jgi:probable HAF family extracellular repeat protein
MLSPIPLLHAVRGRSPFAINPAGTIVGYKNASPGWNRGFVRTADGVVTILRAPGASTCPYNCFNGGTVADAINPAGQVVGFYGDGNLANHGFLWIPYGNK